MGFLGKMFSSEKEYQPLDDQNPVAKKIEGVKPSLEELFNQVKDPVELVPWEESVYVFIGKPPKKFGVAWIEGGKVHNFKTLVEEKGVSPVRLERITNELREAYKNNAEVARYSATVKDRQIVVTPSEDLGRAVGQIIEEASRPLQP